MVGELVAGRYELEELAGTGGMSSVYRAHDRLLERKVALKILHDVLGRDADTIERFRREARSVAQLSHPHIVTVIDRGEDDGRQYIVFEYIDGENLKRVVEREGPLPVRRALTLAVTVGRALAFAHANGLVHRDVKPQNVLIDRDGRPKVTDFGIARSLDVDGMTRTGTVLGTSNYIAPEQASGQPVDALTDVYSLGCVVYELLTGEVPFEGENFVAVALKHVNEPPPRVIDRRHDVPLRISNAVERAMAKDPRDRFPSMDAFVTELQACIADLGADPDADATHILPALPAPAPSRRAREPERRPRRRARLLAPLLALVLIAAAAVAAFALLGSDDDSDGTGASSDRAVRLVGVGSFDPEGDNLEEYSDRAGEATDGDLTTYWPTETYESFTKSGVGLVLDARGAEELSRVVVRTEDTPGFRAEIRVGGSATGPFDRRVSRNRVVNGRTVFPIETGASRYYLVWITELPPEGVAHVAEITARA
jgi:eukaryotic-like serine/threonine-protein kinase